MIEYVIIGAAGTVLAGAFLLPVAKAMPLIYGVSRIRARRAKLLKKEALLSMSNELYNEVIFLLEQKGYPGLSDYSNQAHKEDFVQKTLTNHLLKETLSLRKLAPKRYKKFFDLLLLKQDIEIVLAIIRYKVGGIPLSLDPFSLAVSSYFSEDMLKQIKGKNIAQSLDMLKKFPLYQVVHKHKDDIFSGKLEAFEKEIMKQYFKKLHTIGKTIGVDSFVRLQIDVENIKKALCYTTFSPIKGGSFSSHITKQLSEAKSFEQVSAILQKTKFAKHFFEAKSTVDAVRVCERIPLLFHSDKKEAFSIQTFVKYFLEKYIEVKNIRFILRSIAQNNSVDVIRGGII